jgi:hypothetical protein
MWLDVAVKLSLVVLLAFGAFSGLERFAGKAFGWRLVGYTIAALIVPAIWHLRGRRRPYPFAVDMLFVLPFLIDTAGNALDLYDSIDWWDDANHFVNWALLSGAFAAALLRTRVESAELFALVSASARSRRFSGRSASTSPSSATRPNSLPPTPTRWAT